jgi:hypothetical protein
MLPFTEVTTVAESQPWEFFDLITTTKLVNLYSIRFHLLYISWLFLADGVHGSKIGNDFSYNVSNAIVLVLGVAILIMVRTLRIHEIDGTESSFTQSLADRADWHIENTRTKYCIGDTCVTHWRWDPVLWPSSIDIKSLLCFTQSYDSVMPLLLSQYIIAIIRSDWLPKRSGFDTYIYLSVFSFNILHRYLICICTALYVVCLDQTDLYDAFRKIVSRRKSGNTEEGIRKIADLLFTLVSKVYTITFFAYAPIYLHPERFTTTNDVHILFENTMNALYGMTMLPFLVCSIFVFACTLVFFLYHWCQEGFAMTSLLFVVYIYTSIAHSYELQTIQVWVFFAMLVCLCLLAIVGLYLCSTVASALLIIGSLVFLTGVLAYTLLLDMDASILFFVVTPSAHKETTEFYVLLSMQTVCILLLCWVIYRKRTHSNPPTSSGMYASPLRTKCIVI